MTQPFTEPSTKPVAIYVTLDEVVKQLLFDVEDEGNVMYARFENWILEEWKDMQTDLIRGTKKVFLPVASTTKIVQLPKDYLDYVLIGWVSHDNLCVQPLSRNDRIVPSNIIDESKQSCECQCNCQGELCGTLYDIATTTETTGLGTKTTVTRTCSNGDVIQEITEPVSVTHQVATCDYNIDIGIPCNACDYDVITDANFPITAAYYIKNGVNIAIGGITNAAGMDAFFDGIGFTKDATLTYSIDRTCDIYTQIVYTDAASIVQSKYFTQSNCVSTALIGFPYIITNYIKNGIITSLGTTITNQAGLDAFFTSIGFTKDSASHYHKNDTTDKWSTMFVTKYPNTYNLSFVESGCTYAQTTVTENQTRIVNVCNVEVAECGCPVDTPQNTEILCSCLPCFRCTWERNTMLPYASNCYGEYRIMKENGFIQLNHYYVGMKVYLEYYYDRLFINGNYYIPSAVRGALKAKAYWKSIQKKRSIPYIEKRAAMQDYQLEYGKAITRLSRQTLDEFYDSIRTLPII